MSSSISSASRRPALAPRPTNGSIVNGVPSLTPSQKRPREDEGDDASATRVSSKRTRVDYHISSHMQPAHSQPSNPSNDTLAQPVTPKITDSSRLKMEPLVLRGPTPREKDAGREAASRLAKKTKIDKEKAKLAKAQAEEEFRTKYRQAFPSWKFYFDGVTPDAVRHATKRIEALGAVVEGFLSNTVTHFIIAARVDKENELPNKSVQIPALPGLPKTSSNSQTYNPLDRAKQWGCKIWDITKLESVLDRTLGRPAKIEPSADLVSLPVPKPINPQRTVSTVAPIHVGNVHIENVNINFISRSQFQSILSSRAGKRPSKSATLAGLLATEKATNSTLERDPYSKRHDYTYFGKSAAWLLVDVVTSEYQPVGRLEYKAAKNHSETTNVVRRFEGGSITLIQEKDQPEYPTLFMDSRMRCPFQPYSYKAVMKERAIENKDTKDKREKEEMLRWFRAGKRARQSRLLTLRETLPTDVDPEGVEKMDETMTSLTALGLHGFVGLDGGFPRGSADLQEQFASGFIRSNADSFASLSTATGVPTTAATSRRTTSLSLSQSGEIGSWAKHFGVGGLVPSFGGVRHAPQVVMNRTAFAADGTGMADITEVTDNALLAEPTVRPMKRTATMSTIATKAAPTSRKDDESIASQVQAALRRTQSLVNVKAAKPKESNKKPEGYCECCKEQFESFAEHVEGKKHRKFASDGRRYKELDQILQRMRRPTKQDYHLTTTRRSEDRSRLHTVIQFGVTPSHSSPEINIQPPLEPLSIPEMGFIMPSGPYSLGSSNSSPTTAAFLHSMGSMNSANLTGAATSVPPSSACITPIEESSMQEGETLLIERGQRLSVTIPSNSPSSAPASASTTAPISASAASTESNRRKSHPHLQSQSRHYQQEHSRRRSSPIASFDPLSHTEDAVSPLREEGWRSLRYKGTPMPDRSILESLAHSGSLALLDSSAVTGDSAEISHSQPQSQAQPQGLLEEELESDGLEIILVPELM